MKRKTFMSEELEAAGINVQYDAHAKRVLGSRQVLARILQGAAEEYRGYSAEEIGAWIEPDIHIASDLVRPGSGSADRMITGNNTESKVPGEGTVNYDIRLQAYFPRKSGTEPVSFMNLLINVEAQKQFYKKHRIVTRGIFYSARMISEQYGREFSHSEYEGLKKVYSIWICMNAPAYVGNAMSEYRITKTDVMGRIPELKSSYDKLSVVIICLDGRNAGDSKGSLHGFLGTLLSPDMSVDEKRGILEQDYGMEMEQELEEELRQMCNLSEAIEERGFSKGFSQGISEGIEGFAALTENLLKESRLGDLQRAVKDEVFRSQLFEEYNIKTR